MTDQGFEELAFYVFEELEAGGIEKVVARHGFVDNGEDRTESSALYELFVVVVVLESDALAEEF